MVMLTFFITLWMAIAILKVDKNSAILIGNDCAICGAAAVIPTESTIHSSPGKVAIAIAVVVVFGTLGMLIYPMIYAYINTILAYKCD